MARFTVTASVLVYIELSVVADTDEQVRKMLNDNLIMSAGSVDLPDGAIEVNEDSIGDIANVRIWREKD